MPITEKARSYQFQPGQSGNPGGKPKKLHMDVLETAVTRQDVIDIVKTAVTRAKQGDRSAREWLSDRLWGKVEETVNVNQDDGTQQHALQLLEVLLTALQASQAKPIQIIDSQPAPQLSDGQSPNGHNNSEQPTTDSPDHTAAA